MSYETVEDYLASFSDEDRGVLEKVRASILSVNPEAPERMSYGIVRVEIAEKRPIYFGGWRNHVGLYPISSLPEDLERAAAPYRSSKDSLHFPYADGVPYALITRLAEEVAGGGGSSGSG